MALPFANTPVLQTQAQLTLSACLHEIAEIVTVAGITIEDIVGIAYRGIVCLHEVVALRLLLARLHLVNGAVLECLTLLLLLREVVDVALVAVLGEGEPVHHIAGIVEFEERHEFVAYLILHAGGEGKVQRLAFDGLKLVGNILYIIINKDRSLVCRQFLAYSQLSEAAVVGYQVCQVFGARLHGEHYRAVH